MVTVSNTRHLAGSEKWSKSVYGELYSAVTSTRQATAASHTMPWAGGEPSPKDPQLLPSAQLLVLEEESLLDLSSGTGPELAARRPASPLPGETYSFLLHGDAAVTEETGNIPESFNRRAAGVVQAKGCLWRCHLILLLTFFFFFKGTTWIITLIKT